MGSTHASNRREAERPVFTATAPEPAGAFPLICLGASAGALDDLELLVRALPRTAAMLIVQHAPLDAAEGLQTLLEKASERPVEVARDGLELVPGQLVVAPGAASVTLQGNALRMIAGDDAPGFPIDRLFRAVAETFGPQATAVLLSGTGSDGVLGLRAIRERGGLTIAQNPRTARHASMPERALTAGYADLCLGPAQIAQELARTARTRAEQGLLLDTAAEARIAHLLRPRGIDAMLYRRELLEGRINRRMALHQIERVSEYLELLERAEDELVALGRDLLINVTGFFRDAHASDALVHLALPRLLRERAVGRPLRIWVPGCSSGEEPYSLVMAVLERAPDVEVQVFATDIDSQALSFARTGEYPVASVQDLSPEQRLRFFARHERGYKVCRRVRECVVFAHHDVARDPPYPHLDLVSCRNLLIYLRSEVRRAVLANFHYALRPQGYLLLGSAESADAPQLFSAVDARAKLYTKRVSARSMVYEFAAPDDPQVGMGEGALPSALSCDGALRTALASGVAEPEAPPSALLERRDAERRTLERELLLARQEHASLLGENAVLNQELKASRVVGASDELSSMLRALSVPFLVVDADLTITQHSRGAEAHFGAELVRDHMPLPALAAQLGLAGLAELASEARDRAECKHARMTGKRGTYDVSLTPSDGPLLARTLYIELLAHRQDAERAPAAERAS